MGASTHLIRAVNATPLGEKFEKKNSGRPPCTFRQQSMLDTVHVGPIVDYIQFHKFTPQRLPEPDGTVTEKNT